MAVSLQQAARFSAQLGAYSAWREDLIAGVRALQNWLVEQELSDAQTEQRIEHLLERLRTTSCRSPLSPNSPAASRS
jgi:hypothetical protein